MMYSIEKIQESDNPVLAKIIRSVMIEFGADGAGTSIHDPEVDDLYNSYSSKRHAFLKLLNEQSQIIGCGGYAPLKGGDPKICELRKMYFLPEARGKGWGGKFLNQCIDEARKENFNSMYLETLESMEAANHLYQKYGFKRLTCRVGDTGHHGCDAYYALNLS